LKSDFELDPDPDPLARGTDPPDPQPWFEVNNSHLLGSSQKTALAPLALALFTASFTQSFTENKFLLNIFYIKKIKVDNISM
jgi:hypothetical protein